jgi:hypothetical protein
MGKTFQAGLGTRKLPQFCNRFVVLSLLQQLVRMGEFGRRWRGRIVFIGCGRARDQSAASQGTEGNQ